MNYILNGNIALLCNVFTDIKWLSLPLWAWIVIAAGVIVLAAVITTTAVCLSKKKKHAKDNEEVQEKLVSDNKTTEKIEQNITEPVEILETSENEADNVVEEKPVETFEESEMLAENIIEDNDTVEEEAVVEEETAIEDVEEDIIVPVVEEDDEIQEDEAEQEVEQNDSTIKFVDGYGIVVRYNKSYLARMIQSPDDVKKYYSALKNELLSYKKVKSRTSWNYESINAGRSKIAKFNVRGKTLKLYLALNPDDYVDTKYKVERSTSKRYEEVPCLYRINNARRLKYAMDLIATVAEQHGLTKTDTPNKDFYMPYEETEALIEKALIKELISEAAYDEYMRRKNQAEVDKVHRKFVSAAEVNAIISDEVAVSLVENTRKPASPTAANGTTTVAHSEKKGIINIDVLSANFEANDTVTIEALKEKGLIKKNITFVKVLARGVLNKPLKVELQDYSIEAVKMILLTGGKVKRV